MNGVRSRVEWMCAEGSEAGLGQRVQQATGLGGLEEPEGNTGCSRKPTRRVPVEVSCRRPGGKRRPLNGELLVSLCTCG